MIARKKHFKVTRNGYEIRDATLTNKVNTGISYSIEFSKWDSAVGAGATVKDLYDIDQGAYPSKFLAKLIAFGNMKNLIYAHTEDAKTKASKKKGKR